jgi:phosphoglycolate phosphatase-like HAD superfamily hydrolase
MNVVFYPPSSLVRSFAAASRVLAAALFLVPASLAGQHLSAADPLPSWNEGPVKEKLLDFVERVTTKGSPDFVAPDDRIATFDNDGTLWAEQPIYVQIAFAIDRARAYAKTHPEVQEKPVYQELIAGNLKAVLTGGEKTAVAVLLDANSGMTTVEFEQMVIEWLKTARHPRFDRPYTDLVYQPMLELLAYLRENDFETFIVSGGGVDFMRPWTERTYGIPPYKVVGSSAKVKYELQNGQPVLMRLPEIDFIDDKAGKPVGISKFIGRRPIAAFGNSDGDYEMLRYTTAGEGPRLGLIVHHTDAQREWAYDRKSDIGHLARALDEAPERGWLVMDMKRDWKVVFPFEKKAPRQVEK